MTPQTQIVRLFHIVKSISERQDTHGYVCLDADTSKEIMRCLGRFDLIFHYRKELQQCYLRVFLKTNTPTTITPVYHAIVPYMDLTAVVHRLLRLSGSQLIDQRCVYIPTTNGKTQKARMVGERALVYPAMASVIDRMTRKYSFGGYGELIYGHEFTLLTDAPKTPEIINILKRNEYVCIKSPTQDAFGTYVIYGQLFGAISEIVTDDDFEIAASQFVEAHRKELRRTNTLLAELDTAL